MRNNIFLIGISIIIGTSATFLPLKNIASANSDIEAKKSEIQNKLSIVNSSIQNKRSKIAELEQKQKNVNDQIKQLDTKTTQTNEQIRDRQGEIDEAKERIEILKVEIKEIEARIEERNLLLQDRVRSLQESGGVVNYLDVLLGAQDFGNFVSRVNAVTTIVKADQGILQEHEKDKKLLEQSEAELNSELKELATALTQLESLKEQLNIQIAEKDKVMAKIIDDHENAENELYELEDEEAFLAEQEATIKQEMERQQTIESSQKTTASNVALSTSKPSVDSNNSFIWPAKGTFTSGYGQRWGKLHGGIDIANRAANVPIIASAEGTVIRSYYSSSYGNAVFISHNINGNTYTTVYAHMDSRLVKSGQVVSKGQQIGYMGNTGQSTGKHLHFEIHDGAWKNPINPMTLLP